MTHPNVELVKRFFDAVVAQDKATIGACLADDVVMHLPGHSQLSGTYKGIEQFVGTMMKGEELTGGLQRQIHDITASDTHAVVLVGLKATKGGQTWNGANVWEVRDGKLAEVWLLADDQDAVDAAFG